MHLFSTFLFIGLFWCTATVFGGSFSKVIESDLDGDGKKERLDFDSGRDPALKIRRGKKLLWKGIPARWNAWQLLIADVDGDGKKEIILGVHKSTKFFPAPHNCLFIYGWDDRRAFPKWLGSSLSRPFTDFIFADLDETRGDELIALERTLDGNFSVAVYRWDVFGFTLERKYGQWRTARLRGVSERGIEVEADGAEIFFFAERAALGRIKL